MKVGIASTSLFLSLLLAGCASSTLRITSTPDGADVFVVKGDQLANKIGKTPLSIQKEALPELYGETLQVAVTKDGYLAESIMVPKASLQASAEIRLTLKAVSLPASCGQQDQTLVEVAQGVAEAQRMLWKKNVPEAKRILENLTGKYTTVSVLYELLGNAYYIEKDFNRAYDAYKRANDLQPNNSETLRMVEKVSRLRGNRQTAGAN